MCVCGTSGSCESATVFLETNFLEFVRDVFAILKRLSEVPSTIVRLRREHSARMLLVVFQQCVHAQGFGTQWWHTVRRQGGSLTL